MLTRKVGIVLAFFITFIMLFPQIACAEAFEEINTDLEAPSEHQDEYDEVVNVADDSSIQNSETWDPTYQGIWIGGSTKESLYKISEVTTNTSTFLMTTEIRFSTSQIMQGASEIVIRTPYYGDASDISLYTMRIYKLSDYGAYSIEENPSAGWTASYQRISIVFDDPDSTYMVYSSPYGFSPADTGVNDGNDYYTVTNRTYIKVKAPILPDQPYLLAFWAVYNEDSRFKVYLSPNDVGSDLIYASNLSRFIKTDVDEYYFDNSDLEIDLGVSFDFRVGLGNTVTSIDRYFEAGESIQFWAYYQPYANITYGYHSIMIPFLANTDNNSAYFEVHVYDSSISEIWNNSGRWFRDYILVSSDTEYNLSSSSAFDDYFFISLVVQSSQRIQFVFMDIPDIQDPWGVAYGWGYHNKTELVNFGDEEVWFHLQNTYLISSDSVEAPHPVNVSYWSEIQEIEMQRSESNDILGIVLMISGVALLATATVLTFGAVGLVVLVAGAATGAAIWYYRDDIARAAGQIGHAIVGFVRNLIDAVWDVLRGIGEFLYSVGEGIWEALQWLAGAIMEYGAVLLGLAIVFMGLAIVFFAVYYQLKLWGMGLLLAKGDYEGAAAQAGEAKESISRNIGRLRGR